MKLIHSAAAALLLSTSVAVPASWPPPVSASPAAATLLSGTIKDDVGRVVEGVEVLILAPAGRGTGALTRAISDAAGRFVVGDLAPGVYRVAAIKTGYIAAIGQVNTLLRSSVDLVLRPIPKAGQPGADKVLDDMSWTLRVPPRSVLRDLKPGEILASRGTGGVRAFAERVEDSVRGEVDHMFALGSWRPEASGHSSNLEGNDTRMRVAGALGERGAIQVQGHHGSLDSSSPQPTSTVSRGASDVDLDLTYDTSVDENLAMRAFYSAGDLEVADRIGPPGTASRQSQRSWGYDAKWRKQVDASSHVALQVGYHDASLDLGSRVATGWDSTQGDASNRAIGAEGSYENVVGDGHLVHLGVRAQLLSFAVPSARLGHPNEGFALDGGAGWSLLVDSGDQWTITGPFAVTYGLAVRQGFDGPGTTTLAPRVGSSWTISGFQARAEVSYLAATHGDIAPSTSPASVSSPYGYDVELKTRVAPTLTLRGTASYLPSQVSVWGHSGGAYDPTAPYVTDGFTSDRFVALDLEHAASSATVSVRVARGRAEGTLAPAFDDVPVVVLADRALDYDSARVGVKSPRVGSAVSVEYRALRESDGTGLEIGDLLRTVEMELSQDLVRFAGGRVSCRLLLNARSALGGAGVASDNDASVDRRFVVEHKRIGAGVSLAF